VKRSTFNPPDQGERDIILRDVHRTLLVEAAAGTGKTTAMIGRMVNLLSTGTSRVQTLAAVTFTRKAAAELRSRFQVQLEKAYGQADGVSKRLLGEALAGLERCFIGTIHSFCGRMLRERPVEAGVDIAFEEVDENDDGRMREQAWDQYVAELYADNSPTLERLEELGVEIGQLRTAFMKFSDYPDVDAWPARTLPPPDPSRALEPLEHMIRHMEDVLPSLPDHYGNDKLMPKYRLLPLMFRQVRRDQLPDLMEIFGQFKSAVPVQKLWPGGASQAKEEEALWNDFTENIAKPLVKSWLEYRYEPLLAAIRPAVSLYDQLRKRAGKCNYQDLLMHSARLLRDKPAIREYFRSRFTHLLVDEFQDTDPVQAEVLMYLTSDDPRETNWRACRPVAGSLFVVGDPKQSIYRFRRADIVTYNQVKDIIEQSGGQIVHLSANFRTVGPLVNWVNKAFQNDFSVFPPECSPEYVPLISAREFESDFPSVGVRAVGIPKDIRTVDAVAEYEADLIARCIRNDLAAQIPVPRTLKEKDTGFASAAEPGDFLIVTPNTAHLSVYGRKLQELGIPHQVTGGSALNQVTELRLLNTCLKAVMDPDNPVALVATLRSELFGVSDAALFKFKRGRGRFSFNAAVPLELEEPDAGTFRDAFKRLKQYALWLATFPAISAVEKIINDLGLAARSAVAAGGDLQAGSLLKAVELLRDSQQASWTAADVVDRLTRVIDREENHDGIPARSHQAGVVRVMNLHKVKGLEAPLVFLADPTGKVTREPDLHIDRSGSETLGYMIIEGSVVGAFPAVLAKPERWDMFAGKESNFSKAEDLRLLYVAATRAGSSLTISQRKSYQNQNPWAYFDSKMRGCEPIRDPGPQVPLFRPFITISESDVARARGDMERKWDFAAENTYAVEAMKAASVVRGRFTYSQGEHGTEWGTLIHLLLQTTMVNPEPDLKKLAAAAIEDQNLDAALVAEAVETVLAVTRSRIWRRALASEHTLVEVPFQIMAATGNRDAAAVPTIVRGVIDLAFEETDGWVIVDYKSDRVSEAHLDRVVELYKPQVLSYSDAWASITGSPVKERGLYFTFLDRYVPV